VVERLEDVIAGLRIRGAQSLVFGSWVGGLGLKMALVVVMMRGLVVQPVVVVRLAFARTLCGVYMYTMCLRGVAVVICLFVWSVGMFTSTGAMLQDLIIIEIKKKTWRN
jgi:hypothetical protein